MKKHYKKILLLFIICFPLLFSLFSFNAFAQNEQLNFTFNNEIFVNSNSNINYTSDYNLRNPINYTQIYNASYSFTNDTVGNVPLGWTDTSTGTCSALIRSSIYGHDNVLELFDNSAAFLAEANLNIIPMVFGTIEYYIQTTEATYLTAPSFYDGATTGILFNIDADKFYHYDGASYQILSGAPTPINNQWYHIRVDFDCSASGYLSLGTDEYRIYINGDNLGVYSLRNAITNIDFFEFKTSASDPSYNSSLDALGFSEYSNYTINDNIMPLYTIINNITEIDKWQFNYNDDLEKFPDGIDNPSGWTDIESNKDSVNTKTIDGYTFVEIKDVSGATGNDNGLERTFTSTSMMINASVSFSVVELNAFNTDFFIFDIYSSDSTLISRVGFYTSTILGGIIQYYDGASWQDTEPLISALSANDIHTFDLNINYYNSICNLDFYINGSFSENRFFPLITSGKSGLSDVKAYASFQVGFVSTQDFWIHDIGVYENGTSLCDDSYGVVYDLGINYTNSVHYNLFTVGTTNDIIDGALSLTDINLTKSYDIIGKGNYSNQVFLKNYYSSGLNITNASVLYLLTENTSISDINLIINNIYIRGVSLTESLNKYWLEFEYGNVDIDDNYFYTDSQNRLQYNLTTNDNNTEYIQATFDIQDISSTNRFLSFRALLFGSATATFRTQFLATSNIVILDHLERSYNEIISQQLTIDKFVLLITDDDTLYTRSTTGYYSFLKLRYSTVETTIITLMMISMIIPLIIILTPSIGISNVYGKNLLIPIFVLTSIICAVSLLIPMWLFFVIGFCSLLFIYTKKEVFLEN